MQQQQYSSDAATIVVKIQQRMSGKEVGIIVANKSTVKESARGVDCTFFKEYFDEPHAIVWVQESHGYEDDQGVKGSNPHRGNPALRHGKPGSGYGFGYRLCLNSPLGQFQMDYAINAFQQKTVYFGINNVVS
ncbi:hypothetical protein GIB67_034399 [Kingdonia uniflora]|uniref:Uncharacterized protein n=1 Tax=Kingdonia uniflora TaxID=39325 RepID=A0A7J7NS22_9MAGN|nr:hypothetical protein GIB67_034399 [Kingdonia uniflora]